MNDRSELQENELFQYLKKINKAVEPYSKIILAAVLIIMVTAIGYGLWRDTVSGNRSEATLELLRAVGKGDTKALSELAMTKYPGTPAASWAYVYEGNAHLSNGVQALFADRDEAQTYFDDARAAFKAGLAEGTDPVLRSRAHFGLARVEESLGNIDEAVAEYEKCVSVNESKEMVEVAQERIEALSSAGSKDFIAWFMEQDFAPKAPAAPPSLPPLSDLPDIPDFDSDDEKAEGKDDEQSKDPIAELKDGGLALPPEDAAKEDAAKEDAAKEDAAKEDAPQKETPKGDGKDDEKESAAPVSDDKVDEKNAAEEKESSETE